MIDKDGDIYGKGMNQLDSFARGVTVELIDEYPIMLEAISKAIVG